MKVTGERVLIFTGGVLCVAIVAGFAWMFSGRPLPFGGAPAGAATVEAAAPEAVEEPAAAPQKPAKRSTKPPRFIGDYERLPETGYLSLAVSARPNTITWGGKYADGQELIVKQPMVNGATTDRWCELVVVFTDAAGDTSLVFESGTWDIRPGAWTLTIPVWVAAADLPDCQNAIVYATPLRLTRRAGG